MIDLLKRKAVFHSHSYINTFTSIRTLVVVPLSESVCIVGAKDKRRHNRRHQQEDRRAKEEEWQHEYRERERERDMSLKLVIYLEFLISEKIVS